MVFDILLFFRKLKYKIIRKIEEYRLKKSLTQTPETEESTDGDTKQFKKRFKNFFSKERASLESPQMTEMEQITNEVIRRSQKKLERAFNKKMLSKKSFTKEDAESILTELIKIAIAERSILNGKIERSVETGTYFERYYGKMRSINELTNETYRSMRERLHYEKRYQSLQKEYKEKTGDTVELDASYPGSQKYVEDMAEFLDQKRKVFLEKDENNESQET